MTNSRHHHKELSWWPSSTACGVWPTLVCCMTSLAWPGPVSCSAAWSPSSCSPPSPPCTPPWSAATSCTTCSPPPPWSLWRWWSDQQLEKQRKKTCRDNKMPLNQLIYFCTTTEIRKQKIQFDDNNKSSFILLVSKHSDIYTVTLPENLWFENEHEYCDGGLLLKGTYFCWFQKSVKAHWNCSRVLAACSILLRRETQHSLILRVSPSRTFLKPHPTSSAWLL